MTAVRSAEREYDAIVVGAGPGGTIAAHYLAREKLSVLLIEREAFPRYHIGESLNGIAGDFVRDLGLEPEMGRQLFPLKSGVKVIGRGAASEFFVPVLRPTWQVPRDVFDELLLRRVVDGGVDHRRGNVVDVVMDGSRARGVRYAPHDDAQDGARVGARELVEVRARAVIDATGQHALLSRLGVAGPRQLDAFGRQIAVFSQYRGVQRDPGQMGNNTFIFYSKVHHWAWFIPLSPDVVSIGVVLPVDTYKRHGDSPEAIMAWGLENINPNLRERVGSSERVEPVRVIRNYSYRVEPFVGDGWLCIGDAHRFADPIFSFGVSSAMVEARDAARAVAWGIATGGFEEPFADFVEFSNLGQDAIYDLVRYFWKFPAFFGIQLRGKLRRDIIRLFAGDVFNVEVQAAVDGMRRSFYRGRTGRLTDPHSRTIAERALRRFTGFQGIESVYLVRSDAVELVFVLEVDSAELVHLIDRFADSLRRDYPDISLRVTCALEASDDASPPPGAHVLIRHGRRAGRKQELRVRGAANR